MKNKDETPTFSSPDKAKYIGILFDGRNPENEKIISSFADSLRKKGREVKILAYMEDAPEVSNPAIVCLSKKEVNFFFIPKSESATAFIQEPFDFLLNLYNEPILPLKYISALSRSKFRIGPHTEDHHCFDMMIQNNGKPELKMLIQQIEFYLKNMTPKHETTQL